MVSTGMAGLTVERLSGGGVGMEQVFSVIGQSERVALVRLLEVAVGVVDERLPRVIRWEEAEAGLTVYSEAAEWEWYREYYGRWRGQTERVVRFGYECLEVLHLLAESGLPVGSVVLDKLGVSAAGRPIFPVFGIPLLFDPRRCGATVDIGIPEVSRRAVPDLRAELWELGRILLSLLQGRDITMAEVVRAYDAGGISVLLPSASASLLSIFGALLEPRRSLRVISAFEAMRVIAESGLFVAADVVVAEAPLRLALLPVRPVGVDDILERLTAWVGDSGAGKVQEVAGERGIGKTMFLATLCHRLRMAGMKTSLYRMDTHGQVAGLLDIIERGERESIPDVVLIDSADKLLEGDRRRIKEMLASEYFPKLVVAHRSQLAMFGTRHEVTPLTHIPKARMGLLVQEIYGSFRDGDSFGELVWNVTAGHPLYTLSYLRLLKNLGLIRRESGMWYVEGEPERPGSLHAAVRDDVRTRSELDQSLLLLLAIIDHPLPEGVLADVLELPVGDIQSAVEQLLLDGYLVLVSGGVCFSHRLLGESIIQASRVSVVQDFRSHLAEYFSESAFGGYRDVAARLWLDSDAPERALDAIASVDIANDDAYQRHRLALIAERAQRMMKSADPAVGDGVESVSVGEGSVFSDGSGDLSVPLITSSRLRAVLPDLPGDFSIATWYVEAGASAAAVQLRKDLRRVARLPWPVLLYGPAGCGVESALCYVHRAKGVAESSEPVIVDVAVDGLDAIAAVLSGGVGTVGIMGVQLLSAERQVALAGLLRRRMRVAEVSSAGTVMIHVEGHPGELIRRGLLSRDLWLMCTGGDVELPGLAERREDIPRLVEGIAMWYARQLGVSLRLVSKKFIQQLMQKKAWAGNYDELVRIVGTAVAACASETLGDMQSRDYWSEVLTTLSDVGDEPAAETGVAIPPGVVLKAEMTIDQVQKEHILRALEVHNNNKSAVADMLGLKRTTLLSRMKKLGLMP